GDAFNSGQSVRADQEPVSECSTFETLQENLADNVRARRVCVSSSPPILMGGIFHNRANRMTPSHSNKDGVRYRYYVSHALLQRRKEEAGRVARVPAVQLENLIVEAVCTQTKFGPELRADLSDREVVERFVTRVVVGPNAVDMELRVAPQALAADEDVPFPVTDDGACAEPA